jgi:hypothetical protein
MNPWLPPCEGLNVRSPRDVHRSEQRSWLIASLADVAGTAWSTEQDRNACRGKWAAQTTIRHGGRRGGGNLMGPHEPLMGGYGGATSR